MVITMYFLPTIEGPHDPEELVTVRHKVECWSGQDNKARLLDDKTVELIARGLEQSMDFPPGAYPFAAYEFNGKWNFL